jgi:hypothetical protein
MNISDFTLYIGGYLIFSAEHPIYTAARAPGWISDPQGQKSWCVNSYQNEGKRVSNWFTEGVTKQHRLLSTYINLLIENGFFIKHVDEWGPSAEQVEENASLEEEKERPMFFIASVQKPK